MGSQMILNITNDSWFGPRGEPQLHFALITFRSVETRLPQLRSTNTGISALILPDGTVQAQTNIDRPEILNVRIPIIKPVWTLMKAWGDWFGTFILGVACLGLIWLLRATGRSH
jgi:apolipoprotein N-acyltransferase